MIPQPGAPARWHAATIEAVQQQTSRVTSIFLRSPLPMGIAGQHVDVRLTAADGYSAQRSYSIASAPAAALTELVVECLTDGEVSTFFHDIAAVGDSIDVRGPIGSHFIWSARDGGPLLLIAGGSGVAPLMAIARERALTAAHLPTLLLYSARTGDDVIFRDELAAMDEGDARFNWRLAITRGPRLRPQDFARRIDADVLDEALAAWGEQPRHVYVCGANAFVEASTSALVAAGMPAARIRTERFGGTG